MDPIPNIANIGSPNIYRIPSHNLYINSIPNVHPPVTLDIGFPIVEMPGCVWKHQDDRRSYSSIDPWDKNLVENDSDGAGILCPAGSMPHFYPIDFNPEKRLPTIVVKRGEPPPPPPGAETPKDTVAEKEEVPCPGPNQPRIGDVGQNQKEKVSGYELQPDPNDERVEICVLLYEDIPIVEQYLPAPQVAVTTAGIAAVAATSALLAKPLADLLLRVVKPAVKQVLTKVNAILGRTPYRPSPSQVRTNEYRKKKGLVGINFGKKAKPLKKVKVEVEEKEEKT